MQKFSESIPLAAVVCAKKLYYLYPHKFPDVFIILLGRDFSWEYLGLF